MDNLAELKLQEEELSSKLNEVRREITKEKLRLAEQEFGVRIGSVVKDKKGIEYKVTCVKTNFSGKPWLEGNPKKKDGTFGIAHRNIYGNWTLISS